MKGELRNHTGKPQTTRCRGAAPTYWSTATPHQRKEKSYSPSPLQFTPFSPAESNVFTHRGTAG